MPSAALHLGTSVEAGGGFQGTGAMAPSARLLTPKGAGAAAGPAQAQSRREETANGGGAGPDLAALRPTTTTNRPRGKAQAGKPSRRAPIWNLKAAVFASVVLNVGLLVQHYVSSTAPSHHHHRQGHQACPMHLDAGASRDRRGRQEDPLSVPKAGAPSTGKPAVTPDSVINLDQ
jgi:L-tryptophan---pyruvate aminotransferase